MSEARLIRRVHFRAAHHYRRSDGSDEENRRAFGPQGEPHVHDWILEVRVVGSTDASGFVVDLEALDDALEQVTHGFHEGDLNQAIPEVASGEVQPSTEALARWAFHRLTSLVKPPARVVRVAVFESPELGAEYPA